MIAPVWHFTIDVLLKPSILPAGTNTYAYLRKSGSSWQTEFVRRLQERHMRLRIPCAEFRSIRSINALDFLHINIVIGALFCIQAPHVRFP